MWAAAQGFETYVFKLSGGELSTSSSPNSGCVPNTTNYALAAQMCGVQKTGIHWGEINYPPYPVSDSTLAGEAAGLVIRAMLGNKTLETINGVIFSPNPYSFASKAGADRPTLSSITALATAASDVQKRRRVHPPCASCPFIAGTGAAAFILLRACPFDRYLHIPLTFAGSRLHDADCRRRQ